MSRAHKLQHALIQHVPVADGDAVMGSETSIAEGQDLKPPNVIRLAPEQKFNHVDQRQALEFAKEVQAALNLIENPDAFRSYPISLHLYAAKSQLRLRARAYFDRRGL